jgi:hypothetical protein
VLLLYSSQPPLISKAEETSIAAAAATVPGPAYTAYALPFLRVYLTFIQLTQNLATILLSQQARLCCCVSSTRAVQCPGVVAAH